MVLVIAYPGGYGIVWKPTQILRIRSIEGKATHVQQCQFQNGVRWANIKDFRPCYVNNFEEFGFNVGPFFFFFETICDMKQKNKPYKISVLEWSTKDMILLNKRGTIFLNQAPQG